MDLPEEYKAFQVANRTARQQTARKWKKSEAWVAARELPPVLQGFVDRLRLFVPGEGDMAAVNVDLAFPDYPERQMHAEALEAYDFVARPEEGRIVLTDLGRKALDHLFQD